MTPNSIAQQLTTAGWTPTKHEDRWQRPSTDHIHSYTVALMVADLPRATAVRQPGPSAKVVARLVHLMKIRRVGAVRTAKELKMSVEQVRKLYDQYR